jgi:periplasmic divalent cation tolerance protein
MKMSTASTRRRRLRGAPLAGPTGIDVRRFTPVTPARGAIDGCVSGTRHARIARFDRAVISQIQIDARVRMSSDDHEPVLVLTTTAGVDEARTIARALVGERLAACVNLLPEMTSIYRWHGDVQEDREHQLIIKTTRRQIEALRSRLHALHSYDLPEFLILSVATGSPGYLRWLTASTSEA